MKKENIVVKSSKIRDPNPWKTNFMYIINNNLSPLGMILIPNPSTASPINSAA